MQNKTREAKGPGHPQRPSSPKNKRPSPGRQRDGRHKTRRGRDKRQLAKLLSPASREGSLLALDEHVEKPQSTHRHRSPLSGTVSGSPGVTSPRWTSPRPELQPSSGLAGSSPFSPTESGKLRGLSMSPALSAEWSAADHGDADQRGSSYAERLRSRKIRQGVAVVLLVLFVLCAGLLLWNRHAIWGAQALNESHGHHFCASVECVKALSRVESSAHESADPCTDFYEHACGRWAPLDPEAVAESYADEMYWNYTNSLFRLLERGDNDTLRGPGRSISNFYSSCVRFFTSPNKTTFYSDSVNTLNISERFWRNMSDWSDAALFYGYLTIHAGMPSVLNVTTRNAVLQIDMGTTLAASLKTFGLTASDAVEFVARYVGKEIEDFNSSLLTLDATMEGYRASFDRQASFYAPRSKNETFVMQVLYDLAMHHANHMTRMIVKGTLLVRGVNEINEMLFTMGQSPPNLVAVYCYMIAASDMLAYAIIRERRGDVSRGQASLSCVYTLLRHYHSGFLHWAAKFLQTRYTVDAARRIATTILNEFVNVAPANVVDDVRTMTNSTEFHFYADPSSQVYSKPAKVNPPYVPDDFLRNLVLYAQSPSDDGVLWTPFQDTQRLDQTTRLVHDKRLHVVVPPMFLTEDFFHADAFQVSINLATLGVYVAHVFLNAVDEFGTEKVRRWKRKVQDCHRENAKLLGWGGAADGAEDLDYDIVSRLSVAYVAAFGNEEAYGERSQFFFRRFALAYCASNASVAHRTSIQCAVRHLPPFATAFGCKPSGFTRCRM